MTDGFILKCFTSKNGFVTCRAPILLVNLIDVTLACEDANLKLVEVVTVADNKAKLLFRILARDLVKILSSRFSQNFEIGC